MPAQFNRSDIEFILQQILQAEAGQPPVNPHLAFGLREVSGTNNSAVAGQSTYGSADQPFPRITTPIFQTVVVNVDGTFFDPHPGVAGDTITTTYQQTAVDPTANPFANPVGAGWVIDAAPRTISNLIADQSENNPAAVQAHADFIAQLGDGYAAQNTLQGSDFNSVFVGNITPDAGLSAPFNTWMTLFGQFFDHGLDLITKGGSGTVFIPLQADDPLITLGPDGIADTGDEVSPNLAFMVLTRATNQPGPDGVVGTADDIHVNTNTTTPFVDQNQTYTSSPSHQVFLREYMMGIDGLIHATGRLLGGVNVDGEHLATWADVKANALSLGIILRDEDVHDVPLLATDAYGAYIPGEHGHLQIVVVNPDGSHALVEVDPAAPMALPANVERTGHAFLNDIANGAAPSLPGAHGAHLAPDGDTVAGGAPPASGFYDNEMLDAHYIGGDGRANENIGLTAIHEIFHNEHNRLLEQTKGIVRAELAKGDTAFATPWVLEGANLSDGIQDNEWNGERLFQVAKFGTETQYQHLVFEEFARKIAPTIHLFGNVDIALDPAIVSEFANAVYRFGHSMLDEDLPRFVVGPDGTPLLDVNGQPVLDDIGLIGAFLNPLEYAAHGSNAAAEIVLGTTSQIGNEIDEFVTGTLRNNLLGLPLDLAAINIARGRETGVPPLNVLRAELFAKTGDTTLKPYASWAEFGQFLKHPASLVNFVAAYGTDASISSQTTLAGKRAAALDIVIHGLDQANKSTTDAALKNAYDFMHSLGAYSNDPANPLAVHATLSTGSITGLDNVDLWIGGLAEKQSLFGGLLGSTFNFIFETQLEALQDGDRLYYLPRIEGTHWAGEIEGNSFASLIQANTSARHLSASIFLTPEYVVEAKTVTSNPATWLRNPVTGAFLVERLPNGTVHFIGDDNFFGNTIVLGGTEGNDRLQAGHADDDTVWGDGGDDWIDGGDGNDFLYGGDGNDTFVDSAGSDVIHGEAGDDTAFAGTGDDIVFGGDGADLLNGGAGIDSVIGGVGNDIILGGEDDDELEGNEGDDWIEGGDGGDLIVGDQGAPTGQVPLIAGNDVLIGGAQGDRMQGFSGDDIMLGSGGFDRFEGGLGFDWASYEGVTLGQHIDMNRKDFVLIGNAPGADAIRDIFPETEGLSGSAFNDFLQGSNNSVLDPAFNELTNVNLIVGLANFFAPGPVLFSGGDIILGGDGSDRIEGRAGNDIIDGDAWLHVDLTNRSAGGQIIRQIRYDVTGGDIDTAVYSDVFGNYLISGPDAQGFFTVSHTTQTPGVLNDGIDRVRNIERLQFQDITISLQTGASANAVPTGIVSILGDTAPANPGVDPLVGAALTADVSAIADADGIQPGSFTYQWEVQDAARLAWTPISGATGASFTPTNFQASLPLRVTIGFVDGKGFTEHFTSLPTNNVGFQANVNTAPFVVPQQGLVGLPDTSASVGAPFNLFLPLVQAFGDVQTASNLLTYTARLSNGAPLSSAGLTFTLIPDGLGGVSGALITGVIATPGPVSIQVTARDGGPGTPLSVTDTFIINALQTNRAPELNAAPESYNGSEDAPYSGTLLHAVDPDGDAIFYRIVQNVGINGEITSFDPVTGAFTFTPAPDFTGVGSFQYFVTDGQANSVMKTVTINFAAANDGPAPFTVTGTAAAGGVITALIGVDPDGPWDPQFTTYQWFRDGIAVGPVTSSPDLQLVAGDIGHVFSARATYTDGQGFVEHVDTGPINPVGALEVGLAPPANALVFQVQNTLDDPDNGIFSGTEFYMWDVSTDGVNWTFAPDAQVSFDGVTFAPVGATGPAGLFTRVTATYIDGLGNFNIVTSEATHYVNGGNGADTIVGAVVAGVALRDIIFGQNGADTITGGGGSDIVNGGAGNDTFVATVGDGADRYDGSAGADDLYTLAATAAAASVDLALGASSSAETGTDTLTGIENVTGGSGNDTLRGDNANNTLIGGAGADTLYAGLAGTDSLQGGIGNDTYIIDRTAGVSIAEAANAGTDTVLAAVTFTLGANLENLTLTGTGAINGTGNVGDNVVTGNAAANTLNGASGDDRFIATLNDGNDNYVGGAGIDTLDLSHITAAMIVDLVAGTATGAQTGSDTLATIENVVAGAGADRIVASTVLNVFTGGAGADVFAFDTRQAAGLGSAARDIITDFVSGVDKIDLSALDADVRATATGVQHFVFDGQAPANSELVGHFGYHYETIGGVEYTVVEGNVRTGASATETTTDFQIALQGHLTLTSADFIFGGP